MKGIKLPVLFLNGNDLQLTELGVKSEDECVPEVRNVLFGLQISEGTNSIGIVRLDLCFCLCAVSSRFYYGLLT